MNKRGSRYFCVPDIAGLVAGTGPLHNTTAGTQNCPFGVVGKKVGENITALLLMDPGVHLEFLPAQTIHIDLLWTGKYITYIYIYICNNESYQIKPPRSHDV